MCCCSGQYKREFSKWEKTDCQPVFSSIQPHFPESSLEVKLLGDVNRKMYGFLSMVRPRQTGQQPRWMPERVGSFRKEWWCYSNGEPYWVNTRNDRLFESSSCAPPRFESKNMINPEFNLGRRPLHRPQGQVWTLFHADKKQASAFICVQDKGFKATHPKD